MSTTAVIAATVAILAASAFFVAIEFALLAARRHRLEERAHTSTGARAALRSAADLTLVLAGRNSASRYAPWRWERSPSRPSTTG
jgi:CBS domain containing-hemolysin-like protein